MDQIKKILNENFLTCPKQVKDTFVNLLDVIHKEDWRGACHATTSVLYLLLQEQGFEAIPYIGEVGNSQSHFDHSWIELDGKIIDAAISKPLNYTEYSPVFLDQDILTLNDTEFEYGINWGRGLDPQAQMISKISIGKYMDGFPGHPDGLWGKAKEIASFQDLEIDLASVKKGLYNNNWSLKS